MISLKILGLCPHPGNEPIVLNKLSSMGVLRSLGQVIRAGTKYQKG